MNIHIIGGGTVSHVRNHLALCAPAFGTVARDLDYWFGNLIARQASAAGAESPNEFLHDPANRADVLFPHLHLTKMADPSSKIKTNADVAALVDRLLADPQTKVIVMTAALCDFDGDVVEAEIASGPMSFAGPEASIATLTRPTIQRGSHAERLKTRSGKQYMVQLTEWYKAITQQYSVGFFQIGGGIAGDFPICVVPLMERDLQIKNAPLWGYFCQISDSTTSYGSYSGAVPNEKITWGKLGPETPRYVIESDATIVAPLVFAYVLDW